MTAINSKGEKQLSENELLPLIQKYLGANLFRHAHHYESVTQNRAPYLNFLYEKIPLQTNLPTPQQKFVFSSLFKDVQAKMILSVYLLRIIQYKQTLLCLVLDQDEKTTEQKFLIIAIVFQNGDAAMEWRQEYSFLTLLKISQPFRSRHKISIHSNTTILVTRIDSVKVQSKFRLENFTCDKFRTQGNEKFREKKYIYALCDYQVGLGLTHCSQNKRQRAILYANSSQCLFEMRLYQSALLYSDTSSIIDRTYPKGIYRKCSCYLQLGQLKQVPTILRAISNVCGEKEYQKAQKIYNRTILNNHGIFNWSEILKGKNLNFSEYISPTIKKIKQEQQILNNINTSRNVYIADKNIEQYELIMLSKPLIYCNASQQQKFGDNYKVLISQLLLYSQLEDLFFQKFQQLPSQRQFQGHVLKFGKNTDGIQINQIHAKCLRCLQLEKLLTVSEGEKQSIGIWNQLYYFKHQCISNCTYIHIKGGLAVFAVKDIKQGQELSVDLLNWETNRRDQLMQQKLGVICNCNFCKWEWDIDIKNSPGKFLYECFETQIYDKKQQGYEKISLFYLWNLIWVKKYNQVELMKKYLQILEKYPLWQCIINCLKYLRKRTRNEVFDHIKNTIKKFFEKYFKVSHNDAVELLKQIVF